MTTASDKVSVIIPVYNDPDGLRDTLESLVSQDYPKDQLEILPVDNNSTDSTGEVTEKFEDDYPELVRGLEENEVQSSYAARNKGIEEAEGDILAFIDADMKADDDWLSSAVDYMTNEDLDYMGCKVNMFIRDGEDGLIARYNASRDLRVKDYLEKGGYAPTCSLLVRRNVFDDIGLFESQLFSGGDLEFGKRVHNSDYSQGYFPKAKVNHPARSSFSSLAKKNMRTAKGEIERKKLHPDRYEGRGKWNIKNFLPPSPFGFGEGFRNWEEKSITDKLGFYVTNYVMKLYSARGRLQA